MALKNWTQLIAIILVTIMFAIAEAIGELEIIFPEIAALALGFWIMERSPWPGPKYAIWASPTLAALTGVLLLRYAPAPQFVLIGSAFCLVVLQLKLLRSAVLPSLSASILPIITHTTSWLYPLSVGVLTVIIAFGRFSLEALDHKEPLTNPSTDNVRQREAGNTILAEFTYWGKIVAGVLLVTALALQSSYLFLIAPPLMVGFVEISRPNRTLRNAPVKILLLLFLSATVGVAWLYLISTVLHGSLWLFSGLTLVSVFLLYEALRVSFPPAAAIALLPVLVPTAYLWSYPLHVLAGSTLFILMGMYWFRESSVTANGASEKVVVQPEG